ncbi:MAG: YbfB/YjiJ family MFS transporter, partial [Streptosporangiaceae bacterium]
MSRLRPTDAESADHRPPTGPGSGRAVLVAAGLALGPVVVIGLARFAYSLLLPAMRADLHWSFAQAGAMNTANALGYLVGAIGTGPLLVRARSRRPYLIGLAVT